MSTRIDGPLTRSQPEAPRVLEEEVPDFPDCPDCGSTLAVRRVAAGLGITNVIIWTVACVSGHEFDYETGEDFTDEAYSR